MDIYNLWFDLQPGASDTALADHVARYLGDLKQRGLIEGYRLTRRKLGLGPAELGEFHCAIEVRDLAQLDAAFGQVASRAAPVEGLHYAVNKLVVNFRAALYRDFPDSVRVRGQERF